MEEIESDSEMSDAHSVHFQDCCRICLEEIDMENDLDNIISPCRCTGSSAYMHIKCYRQYNKDRCDTCKFRIKFFDQATIDTLVHARQVINDLVDNIQEVPERVPEPIEVPELNHVQHLNFEIPIHLNNFRPINRDIFSGVEQMLFIMQQDNMMQVIRDAIRYARNFWLNIETFRIVYFFYYIFSELCKEKTVWFVLNTFLLSHLYIIIIIFVTLRDLVYKGYTVLQTRWRPVEHLVQEIPPLET